MKGQHKNWRYVMERHEDFIARMEKRQKELQLAKIEAQASLSGNILAGLLSTKDEERKNTVLWQLSESFYCKLNPNEDVPVLLATLWRNFVWEMIERGEWEEDKRAKFMESMDKANAIINEMNVHLPEKMKNWRYWNEEDPEEEEIDNLQKEFNQNLLPRVSRVWDALKADNTIPHDDAVIDDWVAEATSIDAFYVVHELPSMEQAFNDFCRECSIPANEELKALWMAD